MGYIQYMSFFNYATKHEEFFTKYGQRVTYKKGQYIVSPLDDSPWVFFLCSGVAQASFVFNDGSERLIGYFLPGMTFAKSGSFFANGDGFLEYIAKDTCTLYRVNREIFLRALRDNSGVNAEYMEMILKNQMLLIERIVYQGESGIELKFLRWVAFMVKYYGNQHEKTCQIIVSTSQQEIANFLHVTRVSVGKVVKKYTQQGIISFHSKRLIVNVAGLQKLLND